MYKVVARKEMAEGEIISNEILAPQIAKKAQPGQFVILIANERGERVPLTMAKVDKERGTITVIYMIVGKSTRLFSSLKEGDSFRDVVGPLGSPTHIEKKGTIICIGGGTALAVLYPITKAHFEAGNRVITIVGARTAKHLILEDEMRAVSTEFHICTDDGSKGYHGFGTDVMKKILDKEEVAEVVAIGPVPPLSA